MNDTRKCEHVSRDKVWLNLPTGTAKAHPICSKCGLVRNVSSDSGKKISYFVTAFYKMKKDLEKKGYRISEAQMRLIFKELSEELGDTWGVTYTVQKNLYVNIVSKYIKVSKDFIKSFL